MSIGNEALYRAYQVILDERAKDDKALVLAKDEFEALRGKVFSEETLYEIWCQQFLEWACFEQVVGDAGRNFAMTLAEDSARCTALGIAPADVATWASSQRLLVEFLAIDEAAKVRDLWRDTQYRVRAQSGRWATVAGDIAEMRLCGWGGEVWASPTSLFHERSASDIVLELCAKARATGIGSDALLHSLAQLRAKVGRFQHMPQRKIYLLDQALAKREHASS